MGGGLTGRGAGLRPAGARVPGMNYSTLLQRSVDFDTYAAIIYPNYTKPLDRQLWLSRSSCCGTAARRTATRTT